MEEAMRASSKRFAAGEIVKGIILEVRNKEVLVDIGYKSEGVVSRNEFLDPDAVKVGDEIDVLIEKLEDKEGMVILSHEQAEFKKNWDRIKTICQEGGTVTGKVKAVVKGGLIVNVGVEAFLPASQLDVITPKNLQSFVGNTYEFKVVKINQERQNIVLSRRELVEQERTERRSKLLSEMTPGDIRKGIVKKTEFQAYNTVLKTTGIIAINLIYPLVIFRLAGASVATVIELLSISLIVLGTVIVLFIWNRLPVGVVAVLTSLTLYATGVLTVDQALSGFGDLVVVFIASLFVVSTILR